MHRDEHILLGTGLMGILIGIGMYLYLPERYLIDKRSTTLAYEPASPTPSAEASPESRPVIFRVLDTGGNAAGVTARKNYAAYSQEGYLKLWDLAHGSDDILPPKIDFSNEYVIGVFAGQKMTGGYGIEVGAVKDSGDTRTVSVRLTKPGTGCIVTQALTSPYQIIAVPKSASVLEDQEVQVSEPCN